MDTNPSRLRHHGSMAITARKLSTSKTSIEQQPKSSNSLSSSGQIDTHPKAKSREAQCNSSIKSLPSHPTSPLPNYSAQIMTSTPKTMPTTMPNSSKWRKLSETGSQSRRCTRDLANSGKYIKA
ncbi:MAG: hypothetical protein [Cressdnaviricota sp.]|nr:MAG: hypothetical protein [Cressdnaviricota sp.]